MTEHDFIQKYKYYRRDMLESLDLRSLSDIEKSAINKLILEKRSVESSNVDGVILDGGKKDSIIKFLRWNILILTLGYLSSFLILRSRVYGFNIFEGLVFYLFAIGIGLSIALLLYIFFTKTFKNSVMNTWRNSSFVVAAILVFGYWIECKRSFSCGFLY